MTRADWDDLAMERMAIMHIDAGIQEQMAKAMALADTTKRFGARPKKGDFA